MYSTCIFCHSALGKNESVEQFPVGRRLAFDAVHGRLWVVCRSCERWNLTPIEERWEAIEECERAFSNTKMRMSTDNIGLARLRDGTDLVRVGKPMRPEMAAWRYGDQFGRRRRKHQIYATAGTIAGLGMIGAPFIGTKVAGIGMSVGSAAAFGNLLRVYGGKAYTELRVRARFSVPEHAKPLSLTSDQLDRTRLKAIGGTWAIAFPFSPRPPTAFGLLKDRWLKLPRDEDSTTLRGESARRAMAKLLPAINSASAPREKVTAAVGILEESSDVDALFKRWAAWPAEKWNARPVGIISEYTGKFVESPFGRDYWTDYPIGNLPAEARLAMEMASHEDAERRALEGELAALEDEWREAEEIAAIADEMFAPDVNSLKR